MALRCLPLQLPSSSIIPYGRYSWYDASSLAKATHLLELTKIKPFVDEDHSLHALFPPRVWAIRIPVILVLLGSAVVGSFLSVVMIRSNRKKAEKAKAAGKKKA